MTLCDAYKPYVCPIEHKAPYVCNACDKSATCRYDKYLYNANCAHHEYLETLKSSREGIDMTKAELIEPDELISPLIKKVKMFPPSPPFERSMNRSIGKRIPIQNV